MNHSLTALTKLRILCTRSQILLPNPGTWDKQVSYEFYKARLGIRHLLPPSLKDLQPENGQSFNLEAENSKEIKVFIHQDALMFEALADLVSNAGDGEPSPA